MDIEPGDYVLISHPFVGSIWGEVVKLYTDEVTAKEWVVIKVWDDSDRGSAFLPDDYTGHYAHEGWPVTCIRKVEKRCHQNTT